MKKARIQLLLSLILCLVLTAAVALYTMGCDNQNEAEQPQTESASESTSENADESLSQSASETSTVPVDSDPPIVKGEGDTVFFFAVVDDEWQETWFEIHTDKTLVGEALQDVGLIEGEEGPYGLYVKTVNGIVADYDQTGTYWAFYINNTYGMTGVDATEIKSGDIYMFKIVKG